MREGCGACGLRYEPEPGYFVGAIYLNYALTAAVAVGAVLILDWTVGLTLGQQLAVGIAVAVVVPLGAFHHTRSLWLGADWLLTGTRAGRARGPGRRG
jgi:uncharacterized protein (DUF983 family)